MDGDTNSGYFSMEEIELSQVSKDLDTLGADKSTKELVLNNVRMYNKLVFDYEILGLQKNLYLTYQLNVQISKQMLDLRKLSKPKADPTAEEGGLMDMIKGLKKPDKRKRQPAKKRKP